MHKCMQWGYFKIVALHACNDFEILACMQTRQRCFAAQTPVGFHWSSTRKFLYNNFYYQIYICVSLPLKYYYMLILHRYKWMVRMDGVEFVLFSDMWRRSDDKGENLLSQWRRGTLSLRGITASGKQVLLNSTMPNRWKILTRICTMLSCFKAKINWQMKNYLFKYIVQTNNSTYFLY